MGNVTIIDNDIQWQYNINMHGQLLKMRVQNSLPIVIKQENHTFLSIHNLHKLLIHIRLSLGYETILYNACWLTIIRNSIENMTMCRLNDDGTKRLKGKYGK